MLKTLDTIFSSRYAYNAHGFMLYCMQMRRYRQIDLSPRCHYHQVLMVARLCS